MNENNQIETLTELAGRAALAFRQINEDVREAFLDYAMEFRTAGEPFRQDDLRAAEQDWDGFIRQRLDFAAGRNLPADCVPQTDYALMRDGRILGTGRFRPRLNAFLMVIGGHIGYDVRPSERGKGYATMILRLCVELTRQAGLPQVLLTCAKANAASARVIAKCGGVLENEVTSPRDGRPALRFWVDCGASQGERGHGS